MYEPYWKLTHKPFGYRVSAEDLYRSAAVQTALLRLRYCIENNAGACMLLGPSGVGKTSLIRLLRHEGESLRPFVHLAVPRLSADEISQAVVTELTDKPNADGRTAEAFLTVLPAELRRHATKERHPIVVLDEAHLMSSDTLNDVVLPLLNLVENDLDLQLTVILAGQPVLGSHVARNAQLRDRVAVSAVMSGLTRNEADDYLKSRLKAAGCDREIFTGEAIDALMNLSQGTPRLLNRLCDMALLVGYSDQIETIGAADIDALATEILPAAA